MKVLKYNLQYNTIKWQVKAIWHLGIVSGSMKIRKKKCIFRKMLKRTKPILTSVRDLQTAKIKVDNKVLKNLEIIIKKIINNNKNNKKTYFNCKFLLL